MFRKSTEFGGLDAFRGLELTCEDCALGSMRSSTLPLGSVEHLLIITQTLTLLCWGL